MYDSEKKEIINFTQKRIFKVRDKTLQLISNLEPEDLVIQTEDYVSPIKWHLGHTTWFFEKFLLTPHLKNYKLFNKNFDYIFNSYYESIGNFNPKSKRGNLSRPTLNEILSYRQYVNSFLKKMITNKLNLEQRFLIDLGISHEEQHQELILMDIKNIFFNNPLKPKYIELKNNNPREKNKKENSFYLKNKIVFDFGLNSKNFCYDNELPKNTYTLEPFKLSSFITNKEWKDFIDNGGYKNFRYWVSDGWDFIKKNKIDKPLYWLDQNNYFTLSGVKKIDNDAPVSHISYYEANAYANYKKSRLPNEFEIEYVLKNTSKKGNFLENNIYEQISYDNDFYLDSFYGNLWIWSSSYYVPYKNYQPFNDKLIEYNSKFMCNQIVLKGGSFSTPQDHIRSSYRNFYYPWDRWQFSGLRLAQDLD